MDPRGECAILGVLSKFLLQLRGGVRVLGVVGRVTVILGVIASVTVIARIAQDGRQRDQPLSRPIWRVRPAVAGEMLYRDEERQDGAVFQELSAGKA